MCNHQTFARFFNDTMALLWPKGLKHEHVILFLTADAVPYMLKAGKIQTKCYSKMLHLTYVVHRFHRIAETVRLQFSSVDSLNRDCKKVFLKAAGRILKFKE